MLEFETESLKDFENDLRLLSDRAFPFAVKDTLNTMAFTTMNIARNRIGKQFINRTAWSRKSVQVEKTKTLNVNRMEARVGSTEDYMRVQEEGGVKRPKRGGDHVAIPTGWSAGQENAYQRTKLPRKPNRLKNIKLRRRRNSASSEKQRNAIVIQEAIKTKKRMVYLGTKGRRRGGIFRVLGGKRNPRIKMVHDMSRKSVRIPARPWLQPSVDDAMIWFPLVHRTAIEKQIKRLKTYTK